MQTATDTLTGQTYEILGPSTFADATMVRDEEGAEYAVANQYLVFDRPEVGSDEWMKATTSVGGRGTARVDTNPYATGADDKWNLYVRFGAYEYQWKWRHVGTYPTVAAARDAVKNRTYGF